MRILIFSLEFPPNVGGVEWMTYQLAKHFDAAGNQVVVISFRQPGDQEFDKQQPFRIIRFSDAMDEGTIIDKLKQKKSMFSILQTEIETFQPDAILCPRWDPCGYLAWMVTLGNPNLPYFVIGHGTELTRLPSQTLARLLKFILRWVAFSQAEKNFAVSHFTADRMVAVGASRSKMVVIPNGISNEDVSPKSLDSNLSNGPRLLTVSRLVQRKGCDTVIQSLPHLVDKYPNIEYWIVGDGSERGYLEGQVDTLKMKAHIKFFGLVDQTRKSELYHAADVFVMPVRQIGGDYEGFGIVFLEAMAHSIPVIGSTTGGIPDVIEDGVTGFLVPPDDPQILATTIDKMLSNPSIRQSFIKEALQRINDRFDWKLIASEYILQMKNRNPN